MARWSRWNSLVVTEEDHWQLLRDREREEVIAEVKRTLRQNTVLFLGYDLSDPDLRFLFDEVADSGFARLARLSRGSGAPLARTGHRTRRCRAAGRARQSIGHDDVARPGA